MAGTGKGSTPRQRELGRRIRERRAELGLSQEALALRAGIHRTYIGSLETGQRNPSLENLCRLADALESPLTDLVVGLDGLGGREAASSRLP